MLRQQGRTAYHDDLLCPPPRHRSALAGVSSVLMGGGKEESVLVLVPVPAAAEMMMMRLGDRLRYEYGTVAAYAHIARPLIIASSYLLVCAC